MSVEPEERFDHIDDIFDRMVQDSRRSHVNAEALDVTSEVGLEQARTIVNDAIARGFVTAAELARRTGIKAAAISAFRNSKWKGKAGTLSTTASLLAKALDQLQKQRLAEETSVDGFASTRVAEAIYSIAQYAIKRRKIAAFVLPAGSGKTMALEQLAADTPGAVLITVRARRSTPRSFLQLWARALGLQEWGRAEDIQERCIARLAGSDRLVLIDEVHKAPVTTLDIVRETWDETRVPMVLAGTPSFYQTLTSRRVGDNASELMDQLYSRIGVFRDLSDLEDSASGDPGKLHTAEDIRKVFARQHICLVKDGVDFLCSLANTPGVGGLRICTDLVQLVIDLYPDEPVTPERLAMALKTKLGPREAGYTIMRAEAQTERRTKVAAG